MSAVEQALINYSAMQFLMHGTAPKPTISDIHQAIFGLDSGASSETVCSPVDPLLRTYLIHALACHAQSTFQSSSHHLYCSSVHA